MQLMGIVMIIIDEKCTGCMACVQICPVKALSVCRSEDGFDYPRLTGNCIGCGKCLSVCPKENAVKSNEAITVYAGSDNRSSVIEKSASGGFFYAAAEAIINIGGVVFGCAWNSKNEAEHIRVVKFDELAKLQGSKYVQSRIGNTFAEAKKDLENGLSVLFSGTPCQIAGLKGFLSVEYSNLFTLDLVCHGVPSQQFLDTYLAQVELNSGATVSEISFRDKQINGWALIGSIKFKNIKHRSIVIHPGNSFYYYYFDTGNIYRPSCYTCKYASPERVGDITIGDYWGIEKEKDIQHKLPIINGVSMVMVNTTTGEDLISRIGTNMILYQTEKKLAFIENTQLTKPVSLEKKDLQLIEMANQGKADMLQKKYKERIGLRRYIMTLRVMCPKRIKYWLKERL